MLQLKIIRLQLIVTRASLIYLEDEFFIFSFLVLLKEMKTRGDFKTLYCCFCVWCKSRELGWQGESKIPLCNPSGGKLLLKRCLCYNKLLGRVAF